MPSDGPVDRVAAAFTAARDAYRSAVTLAIEDVRQLLERQRPPAPDGRGARAAVELGTFASEHIDAERFAALLGNGHALDESAAALLARTHAVLMEIAQSRDALFRVTVPAGDDAGEAVVQALAHCGRAFGAARVAALVRSGRAPLAASQDPEATFRPALWTRAERSIAPPLVVSVAGGDLHVGGLAQVLDGAQKIAFVITPPAPAAALARLITPGVFVMQTREPADFERLAAFGGPAVGALVPEGCATFVHDPTSSVRLTIHEQAVPPKRAIGTCSVFQQSEELRHLVWLAELQAAEEATRAADASGASASPTVTAGEAASVTLSVPAESAAAPSPALAAAHAVPAAATAAAAEQPADRLAAWLLAQAGFTGSG